MVTSVQKRKVENNFTGDAPGPPYNGVVTYWTTSDIIWALLVEAGHLSLSIIVSKYFNGQLYEKANFRHLTL